VKKIPLTKLSQQYRRDALIEQEAEAVLKQISDLRNRF
jgi:hypothetical protein